MECKDANAMDLGSRTGLNHMDSVSYSKTRALSTTTRMNGVPLRAVKMRGVSISIDLATEMTDISRNRLRSMTSVDVKEIPIDFNEVNMRIRNNS